MEVQLLYFPDCPHVGAARRVLAQALRDLDEAPAVSEVDLTDPRTPAELRAWGSPTILIDGVDVTAGVPSGPCCRLYRESEERGAPSLEAIKATLRDRGAKR